MDNSGFQMENTNNYFPNNTQTNLNINNEMSQFINSTKIENKDISIINKTKNFFDIKTNDDELIEKLKYILNCLENFK